MSEPLDLESIKAHDAEMTPNTDRRRLLDEVVRLRGELARQAEQITAVRALHRKWPPLEHPTNQDFCKHDGHPWPCTTTAALDYVEGRAS